MIKKEIRRRKNPENKLSPKHLLKQRVIILSLHWMIDGINLFIFFKLFFI